MAINLAEKYSSKVQERFKLKSLTEPFINRDYEWEGVKTVKVYILPTVPLNDYQRTGTSRYGTPSELEDTVQEMSVTQDKSFTFTIDKGNNQDQMNVKGAGKALAREIDEVIVPTKDMHRVQTIINGAILNKATNAEPTPLTKETAYSAFLDGQEWLDDHLVPQEGRVAGVTPKFYKLLKQDESFIKNSDLGQKVMFKGQVGEVDGVKIIKMPSKYFTKGCPFFIAHPSATTSPDKLSDYKIHKDPPGINGNLVEGRVRYDTFILEAKKDALYAYQEEQIEATKPTNSKVSDEE